MVTVVRCPSQCQFRKVTCAHDTYEAVLPLVRKGGFLLADNTLWDGHVTDPTYDRDQQTLGIRQFNDHVAQDPRVNRIILPIRDGLTLIRKLF